MGWGLGSALVPRGVLIFPSFPSFSISWFPLHKVGSLWESGEEELNFDLMFTVVESNSRASSIKGSKETVTKHAFNLGVQWFLVIHTQAWRWFSPLLMGLVTNPWCGTVACGAALGQAKNRKDAQVQWWLVDVLEREAWKELVGIQG